MILIIAEKPSVMKNIIDAKLEDAKPTIYKGYAKGKDFIYTHCIGHLLTLKYPKDVDPKYRTWNLFNLPFRFDDIPLEVNKSVKDQFKIVNDLLNDDSIDEVINACDADREGDLIFRNIYKYSNSKCKNVSRMWLESQTKEGIKESFETRLKEKEYNNVYFAGKARSYADYIIGLNSTMGMTSKFGSKDNVLTIGRVQTPTLRIIVDNDKEIYSFVKTKFYKLEAKGQVNNSEIVGNYINDKLDQNRFLNLDDANKMKEKIGVGEAKVILAETTKKYEKPKMLYSLSDLQVDMDRRYSMTPLQVLNNVQSLYETHKLVTYPRTDENHISKELAKSSRYIINNLCVNEDIKKEINDNNYFINPMMIAKKDIGAHEALTPTNRKVSQADLDKLNQYELKVYMAIVERFMAAFLPDAIIEKQRIQFTRENELFESTFEICTFEGHRKAYKFGKKENKEEKSFLAVKENDIVNICDIEIVEGETQPPARFTEGSLIRMMKNPSKYVEDKSDKDVLKKVEGIGTEATRAHIIEELKKRELIELDKKKYIHPTPKGINLIDTIPSDTIKSVALTAMFERKLDLISKGEYNYKEFLDEINQLELEFINDLKSINKLAIISNQVLCKCPNCESDILIRPEGYFCSNKSCKVAIFKNARNAKGINENQAKNMLTLGNSKTAVTCKSKAGKDFKAIMTYKYDASLQYPNVIEFDFDTKDYSEEKPICKCPNCNSDIVDKGISFGCINPECKVQIFKSARGVKKLTKKAAVELLTKGITSSRVKVKTKDDKEMEVYLTYKFDETLEYPNVVEFAFEKEMKEENEK